ncbi:MAG: amidohydrolase [Saprospiraceae bacterium]
MKTFSRRQFLSYAPGIAALPFFLWQKPELILYNGNFITVDPTLPRAEAVAISHSRFVAVGTNAEIRALAGPSTRLVDLEGKTITPGFIDAHSHPGSAGRSHLFNVDCDLRSIEEIKKAIKERAAKTPKGEAIQGFKYDDTKTKEGRFLHRRDLDEAAPNHPVVIQHRGGHSMYVNTLALQGAGIEDTTPNPEGGEFVKENGKLNGRILENAMGPFRKFQREPEGKDFVAGVEAISNMLAKTGITSVTDAGGSPADLDAYHVAHQQGLLKTRVYCHIRYGHLGKMIDAGVRTGFGDEWVRVGAMKTAIDGSISERTARLSEPYIGRPNDYGILTATQEELYERCKKAHDAGWQIGVHANGDVGIDITLQVYEKLQAENPRKDPRFRLEHCTVINENLVNRIKALHAIPCPFSTYVYFHGEKMKEYGAERLNHMFAVRSFLDAGIMVTQTSDYPPGPFEPMMALQSSVTRTDYKGTLWGPQQKITVEEAIKVGTLHGAYASYEEHLKGSIEPGKLADLTVLSQDPTRIDPFAIMETNIERTMVGGKWVYEA